MYFCCNFLSCTSIPHELNVKSLVADVASALDELRKIASSKSPNKRKAQPDDSMAAKKARQELDDFLSNCQKRKRPKFVRETNLPPVATRIGFVVPFYKNTGTVFTSEQRFSSNSQADIDQTHCVARRQLAMHHRASHERFRSAVISSAERIMNIVTSQNDIMNYNKSQLIEYARQTMMETAEHHKEVLVSRLGTRNTIIQC